MTSPRLPASFRYASVSQAAGTRSIGSQTRPASRRAAVATLAVVALATAATGAFIATRMSAQQNEQSVAETDAPAVPAVQKRAAAPKSVRVNVTAASADTAAPAVAEPAVAEKRLMIDKPLEDANPRWVAANSRPVKLEDLIASNRNTDPGNTASISAFRQETRETPFDRLTRKTVPVAETENDTLALEAEMTDEKPVAEQVPLPDEPRIAGLGKARVSAYVNMRSGPDNGASVVTVVPANAEIAAATDCQHWCKVVYEGRKGFIYKDYIRR